MKKTHWDRLAEYVPGLKNRSILDLGCGRGSFLVSAASEGAHITGLECSEAYRQIANRTLAERDLSALIVAGRGEEIPLPDSSFDFINVNEVFEHTEQPKLMLHEMNRVLSPEGMVYLSIPNRFGIKDQHFHLYFLNWVPRRWADWYISLFGSHKNYDDLGIGRQRLGDMHYLTFGAAVRLCHVCGFSVEDIRLNKIRGRVPAVFYPFALVLYVLARSFYFDSFHLLLKKR